MCQRRDLFKGLLHLQKEMVESCKGVYKLLFSHRFRTAFTTLSPNFHPWMLRYRLQTLGNLRVVWPNASRSALHVPVKINSLADKMMMHLTRANGRRRIAEPVVCSHISPWTKMLCSRTSGNMLFCWLSAVWRTSHTLNWPPKMLSKDCQSVLDLVNSLWCRKWTTF